MPEYNFKWFPELLWAVGIAVAIFVLTAIMGTSDTTDWKAWFVSLAGGAARAGAAAALNVIRQIASK